MIVIIINNDDTNDSFATISYEIWISTLNVTKSRVCLFQVYQIYL